MSQHAAQGLQFMAVSLVFTISILYLAQKQRMSFRFAMGWLTLCVIAAFTGLLIPAFEPIATYLQIDAFALVGGIAVIILLAICIQLSISISGLQKHVGLLNEDLALQKNAMEEARAATK